MRPEMTMRPPEARPWLSTTRKTRKGLWLTGNRLVVVNGPGDLADGRSGTTLD
jgi:hypothetical protein